MRRRIATLQDVAQKLGVHVSTVSRVLNPTTRSMVSERVARRILKTAEDLGYARNTLAAGLKGGRTYTVGIVIPDLTNPLFPPIVRAIERTLKSSGYIAILADTDHSAANELAMIDTLTMRRVDGLILATAFRKDDVIEKLIRQQVPFVLVNRTVENDNVTAVINDDECGIELAIDHLLDLGHKKIAYVGGPRNTSTGHGRYQAFLKISRVRGLTVDRSLTASAIAFTEEAGREAFRQILSSGEIPTAVLTANDRLALGCYDVIHERGLSIPNDVSVTGFNNMPYVERLTPPLTTIHVPHDQLGSVAASLLLGHLENPESAPKQVRLRPKLVVRGSTAQRPARRTERRHGG
jgi:LacI family transcriptional regulator